GERAAAAAAGEGEEELRESQDAEGGGPRAFEPAVAEDQGEADGRSPGDQQTVDQQGQGVAAGGGPPPPRGGGGGRRGGAVGGREGRGRGGEAGGGEVDPEDLDRRQGGGPAGQGGPEHEQDLAGVARQQVVDELPDVVEDRPPLLDGRHDRGEVVVGQDHR